VGLALNTLLAIVFVLSSGIFFQEKFRRNLPLIIVAGVIAIVSTVFLVKEVVEFLQEKASRAASAAPHLLVPLRPMPPPSAPGPFPISAPWFGEIEGDFGPKRPATLSVEIFRDTNGRVRGRLDGCLQDLVLVRSETGMREYTVHTAIKEGGWGKFPYYWCHTAWTVEQMGYPAKIRLQAIPGDPQHIKYTRLDLGDRVTNGVTTVGVIETATGILTVD